MPYNLKASTDVFHAFRIGIDPPPEWFLKRVATEENPDGDIVFHTGATIDGQVAAEIETDAGVKNAYYGDFIVKSSSEEIAPFTPEEFSNAYSLSVTPASET